jgi:hypothetical protein
MLDIVDVETILKENRPNKTQIVLLGELLRDTRIQEHDISYLMGKYCRGEYDAKDRKAIIKALYNKQIEIKNMETRGKAYQDVIKGRTWR